MMTRCRAPPRHIANVQTRLLPPVLIKGEPPSFTDLSARMQALHVPGVSVAVIHGGRIEWARGFGVVSIGGPPVTPDTLFQAASISKPVTALAVLNLVQAAGGDVYDVTFQNGVRECRILLEPDGRIHAAEFSP